MTQRFRATPVTTRRRDTLAEQRTGGCRTGILLRRATEPQRQLRAAHQHLGVPPLDYLIAAITEDHRASILHYDAGFERLAATTDLAVTVEALAPTGSLP